VPYRAVAGSWSGDVFLNSSLAAGLHSADIDLYSVGCNSHFSTPQVVHIA
jgi:hypothetical protein